MNRAESRSQLLDQVERLLRMSHQPLTQADIARRCGVHRSTISRLEQSLVERGVPLRYDDQVGQAWMEGCIVDIQYRPLHAKQPFRHRFAPYFLEPSAIGFSTYAIGYSDPP